MEKGIIGHHIVHRALHDYLTHAEDVDKADMLDQVTPLLAEIIHTRDGARVAMMAVWGSNPKARKNIVKGFKPYVTKIALEEYGHTALCALFDAVDDTVLVGKQIVAPLLESLGEVMESNYGRKVLLYLLAPRYVAGAHPFPNTRIVYFSIFTFLCCLTAPVCV
jgi:pumilio family protein 6